MIERLKNKVGFIPGSIWILLLIVAFGIFLRTYKFHDWMRFSMDQSRDAQIISNVVNNKTSWPLLGPVAGGTFFHLGPIYYYFSIISAKIFGNYPDKMAYPSLFFSILAVPFFFVFLRKYFNTNISLLLTAAMSVSYFFVSTSRFSSNPNLIPFFILLFLWSIFEFLNNSKKSLLHWSILWGVALGVGLQLHTTLLVILPFFTFLVFGYVIKKKGKKSFKYLAVVFLVALFLNIPQIVNEIKTNGSNIRQFWDGFSKKGGEEKNLIENAWEVLICQAKADANFLTSVRVEENCSKLIDLDLKRGSKKLFGSTKDRVLRKGAYLADISFTVIFFVVGISFLFYYIRRETDKKKKRFLVLLTVFSLVSWFFLVPVADSLSIRYFNIFFFLPFLLTGLIWRFLEERAGRKGLVLVALSAMVILFSSFLVNWEAWEDYKKGLDNNQDNSDLEEVESISQYILNNCGNTVCFSGKKGYLERFNHPVAYLLKNKKIMKGNIHDIGKVCPEEKIFYVQNKGKGGINRNKFIEDFSVLNGKKFKNMEVYILQNTKLN